MDEDQITDQMLIAAARKRLLAELGGGGDASRIVNNIYGGGSSGMGGGGGGLFDSLTGGEASPAGGQPGEDPFDYFVDITRKDLPEINEATGKPIGWEKRVHRFRGSRPKQMAAPMVVEPSYRD